MADAGDALFEPLIIIVDRRGDRSQRRISKRVFVRLSSRFVRMAIGSFFRRGLSAISLIASRIGRRSKAIRLHSGELMD